LIVAFDPAAFGGSGEHVARLIGSIEAQPGARLPGSRRLAARRKAADEGLLVGEALMKEIEGL
jgi:(2R)-3-sulfolactate dehydrogenase (NADP+)